MLLHPLVYPLLPLILTLLPVHTIEYRAANAPSVILTSTISPSPTISRGNVDLKPHYERRTMMITAYTANDPGMDGRGITASGERVQEGRTIAAPDDIPFGTQLYIPALGQVYTVTDRGGMITGNHLDLYMERREDAIKFGVQYLEVYVMEE